MSRVLWDLGREGNVPRDNGGGVHAGTRKEEPVTKRLCRDPSLAPGWTVYWRPLVASLIFIFHLVRNSF